MRLWPQRGRLGWLLPALSLALWAPPAEAGHPAESITRSARPDPTQSPGTYGCVVCHTDKRRAFRQGVHSERGIRCHDCHGGEPDAVEREAAHAGRFLGTPNKIETVELCASCHSDPDRMRQYGLSVGQLAEFRSSRHGQLLLRDGNTDAPTCTDCHDAHTILPPSDARSSVHPTKIAATCANCHEDESLMGEYGLPTDQLDRYRASAHGVALYEDENFAAPSCVGCHGSHAALPPQVTEIANVCGRCHVLVRRAFDEGPHGTAAQAGQLPGCTACHSNHGTEPVPADRIVETCRDCHDERSPAISTGLEIQQQVSRAIEDMRSAEEAIAELLRQGHRVGDLRFRYQTALTAYHQIAQAQHSLDLENLEELGRRVASIAGDLRSTAEVAAEHRWEHKLILAPVWFLALAATVLAWFKLRSLRQDR